MNLSQVYAMVDCDGTDDYVHAPDSKDWDLGTGPFTLFIRYIGDADLSDQILFELGNGAAEGVRVNEDNGAGNFDIQINNATTSFGPFNATIGVMYDFAVVRGNGGTTNLNVYINGTQIGSTGTNSTDITGSTAGIDLCQDTSGGLFFNGKVTDFLVLKTALSQQQLRSLYASRQKYRPMLLQPLEVMAYYPLDDRPNGTTLWNGVSLLNRTGRGANMASGGATNPVMYADGLSYL